MIPRLTIATTLLLTAAPAGAQITKALDLVPDDALGFVLIKDLSQLSRRVEHLANRLGVKEHVSLLELIHKELGIREGLNENGSTVFLFWKGKKGGLSFEGIVALPVADYARFLQQLGVKRPTGGITKGQMPIPSGLLAGIGRKGSGQAAKKVPWLVARKGDFAVLGSPDQRELLEKVLSSPRSMRAALQPARDWLAEQDICGVCSHKGVHAGLAMLLAGPGGGVVSTTSGQYGKMKATYAEVEKNVKFIAFGARIDKAGKVGRGRICEAACPVVGSERPAPEDRSPSAGATSGRSLSQRADAWASWLIHPGSTRKPAAGLCPADLSRRGRSPIRDSF